MNKLNRRHPRLLFALAAGMIANACATFAPELQYRDLKKTGQPSVIQLEQAVEVSLEEFARPKKSRAMFDADLASNGILPLLLRIENKGNETFVFEKKNVKVFLDTKPLEFIAATDAAERSATSEYAGKALGWTAATGPLFVIFWPITMGVSARHTYGVNQKIKQHFEDIQFVDSLLPPNQAAAGFLYLKLPDSPRVLEKILAEVEWRSVKGEASHSVKLAIPPIDLSEP